MAVTAGGTKRETTGFRASPPADSMPPSPSDHARTPPDDVVSSEMVDGTIEDVVPDIIQYRLLGCIVISAVAMTSGSAEKLQQFGTTVVMLNRTLSAVPAQSVKTKSRAHMPLPRFLRWPVMNESP